MRTFVIIAAVLAAGGVSANEKCKLDNWKHSAAGGGTMFTYIEGTSNCRTGTIYIRAFEGEQFLGVVTGHIKGYAFKAVMEGPAPKKMTIKYVIED